MSTSTHPEPALSTHYTPGREPSRYADWEAADAFTPRPSATSFTMILPPPNITGALHMGHAYEHTLSDAIARHQRMLGTSTHWIPGTDHAGIATQALMTRQLAQQGIAAGDLDTDELIARTWTWKEQTGETITAQMKHLGASPHWDRATFTLDPGPSLATHHAFTQLFGAGLIYRDTRAGAYCPSCRTALADIETEPSESDPSRLECTRCHTPIQTLTSPQWYLATSKMAHLAREAITSGAMTIEPASMREDWLRWCDNLGDWCLSRQLWWGHRIPIWCGPDGSYRSFAPGEEIPAGWRQEDGTLDTWFSSGLWPLCTLGWPKPGPQDLGMAGHYPNDLLITGSDLLFFWALRMTILCTAMTGGAPFRRLYLHGMIRDSKGRKMSKSFGNTIDPLAWAKEFGPDALRLALARRARPGADIPFGRSDAFGAQALLKKLWSACRLAQMSGLRLPEAPAPAPTHPLDRWLLSRLAHTRELTTTAMAELDLAGAADALLRFTYDDLCDLYLEARKQHLSTDTQARASLAAALGDLLLMLHPIAPFITEELSAALGRDTLLDHNPWPQSRPQWRDPHAEDQADALRELLRSARSHRATHGYPPAQLLPARCEQFALAPELFTLARLQPDPTLQRGTRFTLAGFSLRIGTPAGPPPAKLLRDLDRARATADRLQTRLADPAFTERAPAATTERERTRLEQTLDLIAALEEAAGQR